MKPKVCKKRKVDEIAYGPRSLIRTPGSVFVLLCCGRVINSAETVNWFVVRIDLIAAKMKQEIVHKDLFVLGVCENDRYRI